MSFLYIWKPENISPDKAEMKFEGMIRRQAQVYSSYFGKEFPYAYKKIENTYIGQIDLIKGVKGWQPWVDCGEFGIAWSGVCENFLGTELCTERGKEVFDSTLNNPRDIVYWDGNFALAAWCKLNNTITVTTGATQSQPLWYTNGPFGWACGSRAAVLLDLVGKDKIIDKGQTGLYLAAGYHKGGGTFFQGVHLLEPRHQLTFQHSDQPVLREYITLLDYLTLGFEPVVEKDEIIEISAEKLKYRIGRQMQYSENPILELTGGKDSRCIGAAIYGNGDTIRSFTAGSVHSPEVKIARLVAEELCFDHSVSVHATDRLLLLEHSTEQVRNWIQLSEGLESIRQVLLFEKYFQNQLPIQYNNTQNFHGIHYGMLKPKTLTAYTKVNIQNSMNSKLLRYGNAIELFHSLKNKIDIDVERIFAGQNKEKAWSFVFFWRNLGSIWGSNAMSAKQPVGWWWTPLIDRTLIQYSWWLFKNNLEGLQLIHEKTKINAPHINTIPDIGQMNTKKGRWGQLQKKINNRLLKSEFYRKLRKNAHYYDAQYFPISFQRTDIWQSFFEKNKYAWKDIVDPHYIQYLIKRQPNAEILWSLATIELICQEYF